jgi:hypothetical protein
MHISIRSDLPTAGPATGLESHGALSEQSLDARNEHVPKQSLREISRLMLGRLLLFLAP